ncbi:MAG: ArsC/Spx/MgsR family protein [Bacteroidota bacterium]
MKFTIYHNESCSKSCTALGQLQQLNGDVEIINYLITPPSGDELSTLIGLLGITPLELIRQNEPEFHPYLGKNLSDKECLDLMLQHPVLIQRPIVVKNNRAFIVRPPLTISDIL